MERRHFRSPHLTQDINDNVSSLAQKIKQLQLELLIEKSGREGQEERANELANQVQELRCALEEKEQIAVSMAKLSAELKNKIRQLEEKQKKSIEIDRAFSQFSSRKNAESKMKAISTMMWTERQKHNQNEDNLQETINKLHDTICAKDTSLQWAERRIDTLNRELQEAKTELRKTKADMRKLEIQTGEEKILLLRENEGLMEQVKSMNERVQEQCDDLEKVLRKFQSNSEELQEVNERNKALEREVRALESITERYQQLLSSWGVDPCALSEIEIESYGAARVGLNKETNLSEIEASRRNEHRARRSSVPVSFFGSKQDSGIMEYSPQNATNWNHHSRENERMTTSTNSVEKKEDSRFKNHEKVHDRRINSEAKELKQKALLSVAH